MPTDDDEPVGADPQREPDDDRGTGDTALDTAMEGDGKPPRLASGALRGMVEDYLRDHPGQPISPITIARALGGRSARAVSNALDKLVAAGVAVRTSDKPRGFTIERAESTTVPRAPER